MSSHLSLARVARWGPVVALLAAGEARGQGGGEVPRCEAPPPTEPPAEVNDRMSPTRVLRRLTLALRGRVPTVDEYEALLGASDPEPGLQQAIDQGLETREFYERMVEFGHAWVTNGEFTNGAFIETYSGHMSTNIRRCKDDTKHPGAFYISGEGNHDEFKGCNDEVVKGNAAPLPLRKVEPWWAPGTLVEVVGNATKEELFFDSNGNELSCASARMLYYNMATAEAPGCGCGPNLVWCYPGGADSYQPDSQRRHVWDEPARLLAHLGWHDRPLSDLVTGNYTVGNNLVRAEYVRLARRTGAYPELDQNTTWWRAGDDPSPRDPAHPEPNDPMAWREFVVEELTPFLKAATADRKPSGDLDRTFSWDPRASTEPSPGIAAAGVLTMPGTSSSFVRERPRAARYLEMFACLKFNPPPAGAGASAPGRDIATSGTCQHCHGVMDPVAVAFKRWDYQPNGSGADSAMLVDVGPWKILPEHLAGAYPFGGNPYRRWAEAWLPGTTLTPATEADVAKNLGVLADDTIPPGQEILGVHADGTSGPLGFGKILVRSGAFDRCAVQKIYAHFVGRPLSAVDESPYIEALAGEFAAGGRKLRPFLRSLLGRPEFRRGL